MKWLGLLLCAIPLLVGACSTQATVTPPPTYSSRATPELTPSAAKLGAPGCQPQSPIQTSRLGLEVQGTANGAELWALLILTNPLPIRAQHTLNIEWRMTGTGNFHVIAQGPRGLQAPPVSGPAPHLGSNWERPGDEWGSTFNFPVAGCWDLHATRGIAFGDVWLAVK